MRKPKKTILILLMVLLGVLFLLGTFGLFYSFATIKEKHIGFVGSLSGKFSPIGWSCRDGAILAEEEWNESVQGKRNKIKIDFFNDEGDAEKSLTAVKKIHDLGINSVVGPFLSVAANRVVPFANEKPLLIIGPIIATESLSGKDDYFLRLFPSTFIFGKALANLAFQKHLKKVIAIYDVLNKEYGATLIEGFRKTFEKRNGELKEILEFNSSEKNTSLTNLMEKVTINRPDAVLLSTSPIDTAIISQKLRSIFPELHLLSSSWAASAELLSYGGTKIEGLNFFIPFQADSTNARYLEHKTTFKKRFKAEPTYCSTFTYEAIKALAEAKSQLGRNDTPQRLKNFILSKAFIQGVQGDYKLDSFGDVDRRLYLYKVVNGKFESEDFVGEKDDQL